MRTTLTLGEVAGLASVTVVGAVAAVSLALAQSGRHDGWLAIGRGLGLAAVLLAAAVAFGPRPAVTVDITSHARSVRSRALRKRT